MSALEIALLVGAGALAGAMNAVVGGGTFFTFPLLLALGIPPVTANATSTVALWPASLVAARVYIAELRIAKARLPLRAAVAVAGGSAGALLLLASGDALFFRLVPWLIGGATLLFAFSGKIVRCLATMGAHANFASALALGFAATIYGGYFGAGVGILLMAWLAVAGESDTQVANAQRNLLGVLFNAAAVAIFVVQGAALWSVAPLVMAGAVAGGWIGARVARRMPAKWLRICVISLGAVLSLLYFRSAYFG